MVPRRGVRDARVAEQRVGVRMTHAGGGPGDQREQSASAAGVQPLVERRAQTDEGDSGLFQCGDPREVTEQVRTVALAVPVRGDLRRQDGECRRPTSGTSQMVRRGRHPLASSLGVVVVGREGAGVEG